MDFNEDVLERGMPAAPDIERSLLGNLLAEFRRFWPIVAAELEDVDFSLDSHRRIMKHLRKLGGEGRYVDALVLIESLRRSREIDSIGGMPYILSLGEGIILRDRKGVLEYCQILRERTSMREIILAGEALKEGGMDQADSPTIADDAIRRLQRISARSTTTGPAPLADYYREAYGTVANFRERPLQKKGLETGWKRYNEMTGGLQPGELTIIAARPSMGKTTLACNLIRDLSIERGKRGVFFSLEQGKKGILDRMVCGIADVSMQNIQDPQDFMIGEYIERALVDIDRAPLLIDDTSDLTAYQVVARAEMIDNLDYLIVDYLQYMKSNAGKNLTRDREIGDYCKALRDFGKRRDIPVVCLAQLSRHVEGRNEKKPRLSDLRESGNIEQDADTIAFIHRAEYYDREDPDLAGKADLMIAKQRNGPIGDIDLGFIGSHYRFVTLAKDK